MYDSITEYFQNPDSILNSQVLEYAERVEVKKQEIRLKKSNKPIFPGNIIAALNFGFWTRLLDSRYEMKLWRSKIIKKTFPNMPAHDRMRHKLSKHFNSIRKLRKRVFHYEPIWYWPDLREQHQGILTAIGWIEPAALELCPTNRFHFIYENGPIAIKTSN